jgi:hypothetical protein
MVIIDACPRCESRTFEKNGHIHGDVIIRGLEAEADEMQSVVKKANEKSAVDPSHRAV